MSSATSDRARGQSFCIGVGSRRSAPAAGPRHSRVVAASRLVLCARPEFLTANNLSILTKHVAITALLAVGMTFVILTGGIDLSVGSIAGLGGMVAGYLLTQGLSLAAPRITRRSPSSFCLRFARACWWARSTDGWWQTPAWLRLSRRWARSISHAARRC